MIDWKLDPDFGRLGMVSTPSGAIVRVDGVPHGSTPLRDLELPPGPHRIAVEQAGYYAQERELTIARGLDESLTFDMSPRLGGVKVSATDASGNAVSGTVYLDGERAGVSPCVLEAMVGPRNVEVRHESGRWQGQIEVREGETADIGAKLDNSELRARAHGVSLRRSIP
ncbi:MAG: PEGA domain-containing protein [Betaproteobacteria bacterium]|nr:PEGA domain-containing protein [Betaproteobacteria bacterium]